MFQNRLNKVRQEMARLEIDGLLLSNPLDIRYISGFTGSTALGLVAHDRAALILDFRYLTQASQEVHSFEIVPAPKKNWDALGNLVQEWKIQRLGFDAEEVPYSQYNRLIKEIHEVSLVATPDLIKDLRMVKDSDEIHLIRKAAELLSITLEGVFREIRPGLMEKEVAAIFEYRLKLLGADGEGFDTIVASGDRAAMPHGKASEKELNWGDIIIIDGGCKYKGYNADITRTISLGEPSVKAREIYRIVLKAQMEALASAKAGTKAFLVDRAARDTIEGESYGEFFGHNTGHGIGLAVHEKPILSRDSETLLDEGMTFTVEPGIYLPGLGGVRIEDTVALSPEGLEVLTKVSRELLVLE